jgi:hypothetical protein
VFGDLDGPRDPHVLLVEHVADQAFHHPHA